MSKQYYGCFYITPEFYLLNINQIHFLFSALSISTDIVCAWCVSALSRHVLYLTIYLGIHL